MVQLLPLERETVSVFELSEQLLDESSPETSRSQRLQREGASLQVSLLSL